MSPLVDATDIGTEGAWVDGDRDGATDVLQAYQRSIASVESNETYLCRLEVGREVSRL